MADTLTKLIGFIEQNLYGGHFKAILVITGAGTAVLALAAFILVHAVKAHATAVENDPVMARARRLEAFYLDRPLRAEAFLEYETFKARREAMRREYPPCSPAMLQKAVREAWYNEFVKFELDREIHGIKKARSKHPAAIRRAAKLLRETKRSLPSGITAVAVTRNMFRRERRYSLDGAHAWLDAMLDDKSGPSSAETFLAIRSGQYRCAYCNRDLNENIILKAARTESGHVVPACTKCLAAMETEHT